MWKVVVDGETDENGWQYAPLFKRGPWRRSFDTLYTWVRRRQHHGRRLCRLEKGMTNELPGLGEQSVAAGRVTPVIPQSWGTPDQSDMLPGVGIDPGRLGGEAVPVRVDVLLTEHGQFTRYMQQYLAIRNDVDTNLSIIEKHINLFTWKDGTVTEVVVAALLAVLVLALLLPTRIIVAFLVALSFYAGRAAGHFKRERRAVFLDSLSGWCSTICKTQLRLEGRDTVAGLEERGVTRLALRNWCNAAYIASLDLRTVDACGTLDELADLVVLVSPKFGKAPRRYRAWHSDVYQNFMDHVPSDAQEHDVGSVCYHKPAATSLPPVAA